MPKRALIERRPWLAASLLSALAWGWLQGGETPGAYLMVLHGGALALLAAYAVLRHRGRDTQLLAAMMGLQAVSVILFDLASPWAMTLLFFAYTIGLSLFLTHRLLSPDVSHRVGAAALTLGTPALCFFIAWRAGIAIPVFYGLAATPSASLRWSTRAGAENWPTGAPSCPGRCSISATSRSRPALPANCAAVRSLTRASTTSRTEPAIRPAGAASRPHRARPGHAR